MPGTQMATDHAAMGHLPKPVRALHCGGDGFFTIESGNLKVWRPLFFSAGDWAFLRYTFSRYVRLESCEGVGGWAVGNLLKSPQEPGVHIPTQTNRGLAVH